MKKNLKSLKTEKLNISYFEIGNENSIPVFLMHGFPYDINAYKNVVEILKKHDFRIIVPYLRGFGPTKFLNKSSLRSGEQAALGKDLINLMDGLNIKKAILAGYDWGGRAACVVAALYPHRCIGLISCNGYNIQNIKIDSITPDKPENEKNYWYQYFFHTKRGFNSLTKNRNDLIKFLWKTWSPTWKFSKKDFELSQESFQNPDFVDVVIHSYKHRYSLVDGDKSYSAIENKLSLTPNIKVPTITIDGLMNGVREPKREKNIKKFTNLIKHKLLKNVGHNVPQESPLIFSNLILEIKKYANH